jgi:hypothetical protein
MIPKHAFHKSRTTSPPRPHLPSCRSSKVKSLCWPAIRGPTKLQRNPSTDPGDLATTRAEIRFCSISRWTVPSDSDWVAAVDGSRNLDEGKANDNREGVGGPPSVFWTHRTASLASRHLIPQAQTPRQVIKDVMDINPPILGPWETPPIQKRYPISISPLSHQVDTQSNPNPILHLSNPSFYRQDIYTHPTPPRRPHILGDPGACPAPLLGALK